MSCRSRHFSRPAGFTLIELMVAVAVTFVMVGFFLSFTQNSLLQANRVTGAMTTSNQATLVFDYLNQDLGTMQIRRDGRVWMAATVQPDQIDLGDTEGISQSNGAGTGQTRRLTQWKEAKGGHVKPTGISGPNSPQWNSSLVMQAYVPPKSATDSSPLYRPVSFPPDLKTLANEIDPSAFRFGQAGVWLRFFSTGPSANDGRPENVPAPSAIGYQIVRMNAVTDANKSKDSNSYRYYLMRSTVRPFGDTVLAQSTSTFRAGLDLFYNFVTSSLSAGGVHTTTASIYNSADHGGGKSLNDAGNIRQPNIDQIIAANVIDFGVFVWGRTSDPANGRPMDVLLFPASSQPGTRPNLGFALTTEDGFTRKDQNGRPYPALEPPKTLGWGGDKQTAAAMTYGFSYKTASGETRPCTPVYVDVFLRILDEEGARMIDAYENPATRDDALPPPSYESGDYAHYWWSIATQHSRVFIRRIPLPGVLP